MNPQCWNTPIFGAVVFLFLFITVGALVPNCVDHFHRCVCRANEVNYYYTWSCVHFAPQSRSWRGAREHCQSHFSDLPYFIDERVSEAQKLKGYDLAWLGIRRLAGFYIWPSVNPSLLNLRDWDLTWAEGEPLNECVALNLISGHLVTRPCDNKLPFVCVNNGVPIYPVQSLACPGHGYFLYQSPVDNPMCTTEETIHFDPNVTQTVPANQNVSLKAMVLPTLPSAFPSWEGSNSLLTCSLFSEFDEPIDLSDHRETIFQWFKNGIPIAQPHSELFQVGFYNDPLKISTDMLSRQGHYKCGVYLSGIPYMVESEEIAYFFSDFSTHLLVLEGPKTTIEFQDFSLGTQTFFRKVKKSMRLFLKPSPLNAVKWDFQNVSSVSESVVRLTLLLSARAVDRSLFELLQNGTTLRKYWEVLVQSNGGWAITALETHLANTCLEDRFQAPEREWIWRETKATRNAVSEPMCLNGLKLVTRECIPSLVDGAHWVPFDYSVCTKPQQRIEDIAPECPPGFRPLKPNHCYSLHSEEDLPFSEALDVCRSSSGYLMDSGFLLNSTKVFDDLEYQTYWISVRHFREGFQWPGVEAVNENTLEIKDVGLLSHESLGLRCISVSLSPFNFKIEDCKRRLPFVCIRTLHTPVSSILFSRTWHHIPTLNSDNSCYSFQDSEVTWAEAGISCEQSPDSTLLRSIRKEEEYKYLRLLMYSLKTLRKGSWWMSLVQDKDSFHWMPEGVEPTFVDWSPHTDFDIIPSPAGVLVKTDDNLQWTLMSSYQKMKFICEMKDCRDTRPDRVYLDDVLPSSSPSAPVESWVNLSFHFHCSWSGWFVSDSVSWFKDGVRLLEGSTFERFRADVRVADLEETHFRNFQGYYWCAAERATDGRLVESVRILKRVPGYETLVVKAVSELMSTTPPECSFLRSAAIKETFNNRFQLIPSEGTLHNVTCNSTHVVYYAYLYTNESTYTQMRNELREGLETQAKRLISTTDQLYVEETNYLAIIKQIEVRSTIICPEERVLKHGMTVTWSPAAIGESCTAEEKYVTESGVEVERQCLGDFYSGAYWEPLPDGHVVSTKDSTLTLRKLAKTAITADNVLNSSQNLELLTSTPGDLSKEDVRYVAKILNSIAAVPVIQLEVLPSVIQTVDSIIESNAITAEAGGNVPNKVSSALDAIVSRLPLTPDPLVIASPHLSLSRLPLSRTPRGGALDAWNSTLHPLYGPKDLEGHRPPLASILVPEHLVQEVRRRSGDASPLLIKALANWYGQQTTSLVIEADFVNYPLPKEPLYPRVEIEFTLPEDWRDDRGIFQCVFWDHALNGSFGGWSYKGCSSHHVPNTSRVLCYCDHLTAFSLLFDFQKETTSKGHALALEVITYLGCILSIIGLLLTMLTFCLFRTFRKRMQLKALFNLSLSLTLFLVLFLAGFVKHEDGPPWWCLGVALMLHYLLLATFAWMLVEAYLQYLSLVKVFRTYIPKFIQKAMLFAWGLPLVAVSAVLSVDHTLYYSNHNYCWLSTAEAFYYAVAAPVLLMLVANFVIFLLILYYNTCGRDSKILRSNQNQRQEAITRARAIFSVSILLGLSWIFGFLSLISEDMKLLFSYLFALTTTSQGFFIFVFYVFRHRSVRQLWLGLVVPQNYSVEVSRCSTELLKASHISGTKAVFSREAEERPYVHFNANFSCLKQKDQSIIINQTTYRG